MPLTSYRMHRIYLAATMNYGLGSDDPEELAYYNKIRKEMDDMKKEPVKKGIPLNLFCTLQNHCAAGSLDWSNPAHFKIALVAQR